MRDSDNNKSFFVSDLHGKMPRYEKLFQAIENEKPGFVFIGGDILPHVDPPRFSGERFLKGFFLPELENLYTTLGESYPSIFIILGNDDGRHGEETLQEATEQGLVEYIHGRRVELPRWQVFGYAYVPPTPFMLKDWERYDVSRFLDVGCISPEEGIHCFDDEEHDLKYGTIKEDLEVLTEGYDLNNGIFLFHSPPYQSNLDRADLDGVKIDHAPVDVNVGSIAIRRFIENRQPLLTMHGHVHESARLTGSWKEHIGRTLALSAAHDGPELALVSFDLDQLQEATRRLL
ncbi:MAG: hypothetical protein GF417_09160 [Candidatus Latescibacteria bacterium]|nr:hypothetical protein [bacterium]MBD3424592.1 hypothetical protein [Candidatus Latescibacterota bacterium]